MSSCLKATGRTLASLLLLAPALLATGCAQQQPSPPPAQPMEIDAAMQRRDWERSAAWYPNGDTLAGVQRFPLRPQGGSPGSPDYTNAAIDLAASMGQTIVLPFTYLFVPPFAPQVFTGEAIPATYTAMPEMAPPTVTTTYGQPMPTREQELRRLQSPEPLPRPAAPRDERRGPLGPGDADFMSSPPTVEEPD
jgi:hypothetical protein